MGVGTYDDGNMCFEWDPKTHRVLLPGSCARGSKNSHTGGKCVTCHVPLSIKPSTIKNTDALALDRTVCSRAYKHFNTSHHPAEYISVQPSSLSNCESL